MPRVRENPQQRQQQQQQVQRQQELQQQQQQQQQQQYDFGQIVNQFLPFESLQTLRRYAVNLVTGNLSLTETVFWGMMGVAVTLAGALVSQAMLAVSGLVFTAVVIYSYFRQRSLAFWLPLFAGLAAAWMIMTYGIPSLFGAGSGGAAGLLCSFGGVFCGFLNGTSTNGTRSEL
jgi:hypothetical protein